MRKIPVRMASIRVHLARSCADLSAMAPGRPPIAKMIRVGLGIGVGFSIFAFTGRPEDGVIGAIFANLLGFNDQEGPLGERVGILVAAALAIGLGSILGAVCSGHEAAIVAVAATFALIAGLVHGWLPGVEMIPRNALIAFVACAYLPLVGVGTIFAAGVSALVMLMSAVVDGLLRRSAAGPRLADLRVNAKLPELRFGICYALVATLGLIFADAMGANHGYWVTITSVLVMQPDSIASINRALQRLVGTTAGIVLAYGLTTLIGPHDHVEGSVLVALVLPFVWPAAFAKNYGLGVVLISAWILILINIALPPSEAGQLFAARLYDTAIGSTLAIIGTVFAAPTALRRAWMSASDAQAAKR